METNQTAVPGQGADHDPASANTRSSIEKQAKEEEQAGAQKQPSQVDDTSTERKAEPMDISGTGSNFEESDFVAVPDKD